MMIRTTTRLLDCPIEILLLICSYLDYSSLLSCSLTSVTLSAAATHTLFLHINLTSLAALAGLLDRLQPNSTPLPEHDDYDPAPLIQSISLRNYDVVSQHKDAWSTRMGKLLRQATNCSRLEIVGVQDFRMKLLYSPRCQLRKIVLRSITFRPHSLPRPPSLSTLCSVTSLTLANLGLPDPATHFFALLSSTPHLLHLSLSSLRDLSSSQFNDGLSIVGCHLRELYLGSLTPEQAEGLNEAFVALTRLESIQFQLPLPWTTHLAALPHSVKTLKMRPTWPTNLEEEDRVIDLLLCAWRGNKRLTMMTGVNKVILWKGIRRLRVIEEVAQTRGVMTEFI